MPTISIDITDAALTDLVNAHGYDRPVDGQPVSLTPRQFARRLLVQYAKEAIRQHRRAAAIGAVPDTDPEVS